MKSGPRPPFRSFARVLALCMAFMQIVQSVHAAATDLDDVPVAVMNSVKPNVMFTLDDSGSMQFEVIPENPDVYFTFPRADPLYGANWGYATQYDTVATFDLNNRYARFFRTAQFNGLYYNPAVGYRPWSNADGSLMGNSSPTAACHNPNKCPALTAGSTSEGTLDLTADHTWNVYWRDDDGSETQQSRTYYPATYFNYVGSTPPPTADHVNNIQAAFNPIEIKAVNAPFTKAVGRTDCAGSSCTYDEEIQNFANWYTYYRSRVLAARAGVGRAFSAQGTALRVGFGAINKGNTTVDNVATETVITGVRKFEGADRTGFFTNLYGHVMPSEGTPLRKAMDDVGQYFSRTDDRGPWGETPGSTGGSQFSCRQSYHILMTDGYWNGDHASTSGARDNNDGTAGPTHTNARSPATPPTFTYAAANPYSDSHSNTLADVAMYYWKNDLRTDLPNKVPPNSTDPAFWQHMVNMTVGFGVTGTISSDGIASAFTSTPQTINWPDPVASDPSKVDDLAHAAINSRGGYFSAADPATFASALAGVFEEINGREGAGAAVAVANAHVTASDNASYQSTYNSGEWSGNLFAYPIDVSNPASASYGTVDTSAPIWASSAQAQLDALVPADRKIASYTGTEGAGQGIEFQPTSAATTTKLSAAQQALLNTPSLSDGADVLAFIRGVTALEGSAYRDRAHVLGDIINAEPVLEGAPQFSYGDSGYAAFKTAQVSRTKVLFQGANDGMLHAFNAATGAEDWAYIPNLLLGSLNNLSRKSGFTHKYYVDATPSIGDVDFAKTDGATGGADWRTILVGGLGKGGRGFYALDVTTSTAGSEAAAAAKVLWEFPNSATDSSTVRFTSPTGQTTATMSANKIGYSFGKPVITKTKAHGWVVLVSSGYNNGDASSGADYSGGDGHGYVFVLNAKTGALLHAFDTGVGSASTPSGLAHISGYGENPLIDNTVQYAYGGDLQGNVWRFDMNDASTANWKLKRLAALVDASGTAQPVTTVPELARILINAVSKRFVYVGTGKYLGDTDVSDTQTQSMYGLLDDLSNPTDDTPVITPLRASLQQQTLGTGSATRSSSENPVDYTTKKGWYVDLPISGERVNTNPVLALGTLIFTSNIPSNEPCSPGGSSWLNILDYKTGSVVKVLESGTYKYLSSYLGEALASRPVLVQLPDGSVKVLIRKSDSTTESAEGPPSGAPAASRRVSWKEITGE